MFSMSIIVFREILEIALVVGVVLAATRGLRGRVRLVLAGLGLGAVGSAFVALFTDSISQFMDGVGQEVFNAAIMFTAVGFLSWTVLWMRKHGRELTKRLSQVSKDVLAGEKPPYVLIVIIALATLREGAEIVLFAYGMSLSGQLTAWSLAAGITVGTVAGLAVGLMLYYGLLKAAKRHLFTVTSWMLILLTAGMAAQGAGFLVAAGVIPDIVPQVWDSSWLIAADNIVGEVLGVLIGYTPRPSGMELLCYAAVLVLISIGYYALGRTKRPMAAV